MPSLSPEQNQQIAAWINDGDNLSTLQKKLRETWQLSLTYMDVRFLVDDLQLQLKDPPQKQDPDKLLQQQQPAADNPPPHHNETPDEDDALPADPDSGHQQAADADKLPPDNPDAPIPNVSFEIDAVTLDPTALASGTVRFSDNVTAKWMIDQYGRPQLFDASQPDYHPAQSDAQAFLQQLAPALREKGLM